MTKEKTVLIISAFILLNIGAGSRADEIQALEAADFQEMLKDCDKENEMLKKGEYEIDYHECFTIIHGLSDKTAKDMLGM